MTPVDNGTEGLQVTNVFACTEGRLHKCLRHVRLENRQTFPVRNRGCHFTGGADVGGEERYLVKVYILNLGKSFSNHSRFCFQAVSMLFALVLEHSSRSTTL